MNTKFPFLIFLMLLSIHTNVYAQDSLFFQDKVQTSEIPEYNEDYARSLSTEEIYEIGLICYKAEEYPNAVLWFEKAAENNDPNAQFYLGYCYFQGFGVDRDYKKAAYFFGKSTQKETRAAQYNLGCLYFNGWGVEEDRAKAVELFRKSAEQGYADAQNNLGYCYDHGLGVEQDYDEAIKWYRKAADQGHKLAAGNLKALMDKKR